MINLNLFICVIVIVFKYTSGYAQSYTLIINKTYIQAHFSLFILPIVKYLPTSFKLIVTIWAF